MCKGTMLDESLSVPQSRATIKNQTDLLRVIVFDEKTGKVFASVDWTSAMPSTIATVTSLLPMEIILDSTLCFSRMCINVRLQEQCIIVPSEANRDLGTTVNS